MSGVFYARPISIPRLIEIFFLNTDVGIYGSLMGIMSTFVAIFVIFLVFWREPIPVFSLQTLLRE